MKIVSIIGAGPGNEKYGTVFGTKVIEESNVLFGDKRLLAPYEGSGKILFHMTESGEIEKNIRLHLEEGPISVLVSGDSGFYSLTKTLLSRMKDIPVQVVPGISSIQILAAALGVSWDDAALHSMHGRKQDYLSSVARKEKTILLLDHKNNAKTICQEFIDSGLDHLMIYVGEHLSYDNQRILSGKPENFTDVDFSDLSIMLVMNNKPIKEVGYTPGIADELFTRGKVPMTKRDIRVLTLSKLSINKRDVLYDIGAGTGSVSIEMALSAPEGRVYAIEKNETGIGLIKENKEKLNAYNLNIIHGTAPEMLEALPKPDKAFIGGTSDRLPEILEAVYGKNPETLVVINAVTIETLAEATSFYKNRAEYETELLSVSIAEAEKVGSYHMMKGQNPIYILTAKRK